ncbi:MAG: hypothetical protein CVU38_08480 [Chloroflexi bacterium HGW-Chloroflexi-1]|nr:MAG: hypothetical protein CVU38_08480 [Chloroflexi bacterium HGW-Chloroflexi-1]
MSHRLPLILIVVLTITAFCIPTASAAGPDGAFTVISLVYEDQNIDGVYGLSASGVENAISGITINLYPDNEPCDKLGAEDKLLQSQTSNVDGYVVFRDLLAGSYLVSIEVPAQFIASNPTTQTVLVGGEAAGALVEWMFGLIDRSNLPVRNFLPIVAG